MLIEMAAALHYVRQTTLLCTVWRKHDTLPESIPHHWPRGPDVQRSPVIFVKVVEELLHADHLTLKVMLYKPWSKLLMYSPSAL